MNSRCDTTFIMNRMVIIICLSLLAIPAFCSYDPALLTPAFAPTLNPPATGAADPLPNGFQKIAAAAA